MTEDTPEKQERRKKSRLARELALRLLFQYQTSTQTSPEEIIRLFEQCFSPNNDPEDSLGLDPELFEKAWPKAKHIFLGTVERLSELDEEISGASINWTLKRMSPVDLAVMRLSLYEMRHGHVPPKVSVNEAIEMARDYGNYESTSFVNGVLDKLIIRREKPPRDQNPRN